jgi:hypothetical protein
MTGALEGPRSQFGSFTSQLLVESLVFRNEDEAITYNYTPARDTLREKTSGALV